MKGFKHWKRTLGGKKESIHSNERYQYRIVREIVEYVHINLFNACESTQRHRVVYKNIKMIVFTTDYEIRSYFKII